MENVESTKKYFAEAIKSGLLNFKTDGTWLIVEYKENLGYTSEDGTKWSLICAQDLKEYQNQMEIVNRITLMLAEQLRSVKQDFNGEFNRR